MPCASGTRAAATAPGPSTRPPAAGPGRPCRRPGRGRPSGSGGPCETPVGSPCSVAGRFGRGDRTCPAAIVASARGRRMGDRVSCPLGTAFAPSGPFLVRRRVDERAVDPALRPKGITRDPIPAPPHRTTGGGLTGCPQSRPVARSDPPQGHAAGRDLVVGNASVEPAAWTARGPRPSRPGRSGPRPGTRPRRHHPGRPVPAAGCSGRRTNERRGRTRSRGSRRPPALAAEHSGGRDCAGSVWPPNSRWARIRNHWNALGPEPRARRSDGRYSPWENL